MVMLLQNCSHERIIIFCYPKYFSLTGIISNNWFVELLPLFSLLLSLLSQDVGLNTMLLSVIFISTYFSSCYENGVDYDVSNTIQTISNTPSPSQCQEHCGNSSKCFSWTWNNTNHCDLKRDIYGRAPDRYWSMVKSFPELPKTKMGYVSGPKRCPDTPSQTFTRKDLINEIIKLSNCKFDNLEEAKTILSECGMKSSKRNSQFSHWQVSHSSSSYKRTYPRRQWEDCTVENRFCRCSTAVRFGTQDWWSQPSPILKSSLKCVEPNFKFSTLQKQRKPLGRRRCQCLTSESEMTKAKNGAYLAMSVGVKSNVSSECELHASMMSEKINMLSGGWGETIPHILLGLAGHCLELPKWISLASWKQDAKTFRLPCESLTAFDFNSIEHSNTGLYYTQRINHWRWMPMNISVGIQTAVLELFGVEIPTKLHGGPIGNPEIKMWSKLGWSHPCCQYHVVSLDAQRAYAQFLLLISIHIADGTDVDSAAASAGCFLWLGPSVGCVSRYFGYLTEALFILFTYLTQRLVPLAPGSQGFECSSHMISNHTLYGAVTHDAINVVFREKFLLTN